MQQRGAAEVKNGVWLLLAVAFLLILPASCKEPDQIQIDVTTDVPCSTIQHVAIGVASTAARTYADLASGSALVTARCDGYFLGSVVVQPGSPSAAITAVLAYRGGHTAAECVASNFSDCIVSRRRLPFAGRPLKLTMRLAADCKGISCSLVSTCQGKRCLDSSVSCNADDGTCLDPSQPPPDDAGPPEVEPDAGREDGGTTSVDGSVDGSGDARTDGSTDGGNRDDGGSFPNIPPVCPPTTCTLNQGCCYDPDVGGTSSCRSAPGDCTTTFALFVQCRQRADCLSGSCLVENIPGTMAFRTYCGTSTPTSQVVCATMAECNPGSTCLSWSSGTVNNVIKTCGPPVTPH